MVDNAELSQAIKLTYEKRSAEIKIDDKVKIVEQDNKNDDDNSENEKYKLISNLI